MTDPARRFVELTDPDDGTTTWRLDAGFLDSGFTCIWGDGCQGIHDTRRPELMDGCCSVGVVLADDDEAMTVAALAATLAADEWEHQVGDPSELLVRHGTHWATRVVDGACVMLNRPGFAGGAGCALHLGAVRRGEAPFEWKPRTCSRVPLRVDEVRSDAATTVTVRAWRRDDWGPGGATMAWWCTEDPGALRSDVPLHERIEPELLDLVGPELLTRLRQALGGGRGREERPGS